MLLVFVMAFEPKEETHCVAGFEWRLTQAEAEEAVQDIYAPENYHIYRFRALVTSKDTATDELDEAWSLFQRGSRLDWEDAVIYDLRATQNENPLTVIGFGVPVRSETTVKLRVQSNGSTE